MTEITLTQRLFGGAGDSKRVSFSPINDDLWRPKSIHIVPNETSADDATDYVGLRAYTGASTAITADRNTSATGLTQGTPEAMAVTGTQKEQEVNKTTPLTVRAAQVASGVPYDVSVTVVFENYGDIS